MNMNRDKSKDKPTLTISDGIRLGIGTDILGYVFGIIFGIILLFIFPLLGMIVLIITFIPIIILRLSSRKSK